MLTRALIVMLVVLNLGVAAWWFWRPAPAVSADDIVEPSGVARLQLLQERKDPASRPRVAATSPATSSATTQPAAATQAPLAQSATPAAPATTRCYRFGPFADDTALASARNALQPLVAQLRTQIAAADRGRGWRVIVPPSADRATANALAERIKQAGFPDLFVIGESVDANAIALGRFNSEDRAQAHAARLRDAGFAAQAQPLGEAKPAERWLLAATGAGFDAVAARRASGAAQAGETDCAAMR